MGKPHTSKNKLEFASEEDQEKFSSLLENIKKQYGFDILGINIPQGKDTRVFYAVINTTIELDKITNKKIKDKGEKLTAKISLISSQHIDKSIIFYTTKDYCYFEKKSEFYNFFNFEGETPTKKFNAFTQIFFSKIYENRFKKINVKLSNNSTSYYTSDSRKEYCFGIYPLTHFNNKPRHRTKENSDKAQKICPTLFKYVADITTVSFYFSPDPSKGLSELEILRNYLAYRNGKS